MNELPNEISNLICSYIESPTNKIIQNLYFDPLHCLKLNKRYNFKHIQIDRLLYAINTRCPNCLYRLTPEEYVYIASYEILFHKKLCFDCLQKEKTRMCFESSELIILIMLLVILWAYILHLVSMIEMVS